MGSHDVSSIDWLRRRVLLDPNVDVTLFESAAIVLHLLDTYDLEGKLLAKNDPKARALVYLIAFYCSSTLDNLNATSSPIQQAVMQHQKGQPASMNPPGVDQVKLTAWVEVVAPFFEGILQENKGKGIGDYLLGNFSVADVLFGHSLFGIHNKPISRGLGS